MRIWLLLFFVAIQSSSFAASEDVMPVREAIRQHLLLVAAMPRYPEGTEGRIMRRRFVGVYELKFDYESGHLREVHVVKSMGEQTLEAWTIGALKVWQAKPRSIHNLLVPVQFKPFGL